MDFSRKVRRQQRYQLFIKQSLIMATWIFLTLILGFNWYWGNVLTVTLLAITIFFGILCINPYNIRNFVPGLTNSHFGIRCIATLLYLIAVFALISHVSINSH